MSERAHDRDPAYADLWIDFACHRVPKPVEAHFRFMSAQLSSMAETAARQAARIAALEAVRASTAEIIAARFELPMKAAQVVATLLQADGEFVLSATLAERCGSTPNAVAVHAHRARAGGVEVVGHRKRGYRLTPEAMEKCRAACGIGAPEAAVLAEVAA